ncbi:signal peptide protein [Burkholderiaceae bacterium 16]|nr:signal peptide protein [Burkholderiaceae bacterium 16]
MHFTAPRSAARAAVMAARVTVLAGALLGSAAALAQATPAGSWKTIDDATGKPRGLVEISEHNGVYSGKLVKSFGESDGKSDGKPKVCDKCTDSRRDQPIMGMTIITGLRKTGDNEWSGGEILDPESGKLYKTKMSLADDGTKLKVRGFIGISLLGRTQTWERER